MEEFDGLKLLVQAEENFGRLKNVSKKTGVPLSALRSWLRGGKLSDENRKILSKDIDPAFTGKVIVS